MSIRSWLVPALGSVILVCGASGPGARCTAASSDWAEAVVAKVRPAVCRIKVYDRHGVCFGQGTGFVVAPGRVATCYHVIMEASKATLEFPDRGSVESSTLAAADPDRDLAVLAIDGTTEGLPPLPLTGLETPKQGASVVALGHPLSLALTVSKGIITALPTGADLNRSVGFQAVKSTDRLIQTDAAISPGNSGGPLVDAQGRVVAVMAMIRKGGENLAFGIPSAYLRELLQGNEDPRPLAKAEFRRLGWHFGSPILPPRPQKVTLAEVTRHVGRLLRITRCRRCGGGGKISKRVVGRRGADWRETDRCPACRGRGYIRTNSVAAYQILADLAVPLVYLDTQATAVRPTQAKDVREAVVKVVDRVSKTKIPVSWVERAVGTLRGVRWDEPRGVCFVGRIVQKVTLGRRDYLLTKVEGADDLNVAIVAEAGRYAFDPRGGRSDFDPDGSYLIGGVALGCRGDSEKPLFRAFVWPAFLVRPGVVYYARTYLGRLVPVDFAPRTFFLPIKALGGEIKVSPHTKSDYITLD